MQLKGERALPPWLGVAKVSLTEGKKIFPTPPPKKNFRFSLHFGTLPSRTPIEHALFLPETGKREFLYRKYRIRQKEEFCAHIRKYIPEFSIQRHLYDFVQQFNQISMAVFFCYCTLLHSSVH